MADAGVEHPPGVRLVHLTTGYANGPAFDLGEPGDRLDQLRLAVAVHTCDADDLAGPHVEGDAADLFDPAVVAHMEVLHCQQHVAGLRRRLVDAQQHLAPDHRARKRLLGRLAAGTVSIFLPRRSTVIRSAISSTSFSLWLMKMIDFPSALRLFTIPKSSWASCGVSTAVGSSRIRMSAPR